MKALQLLAALLLAGCGGGGNAPDSTPKPQPVPPPPQQAGTVLIGDGITAGWPASLWPAGAHNAGRDGNTTVQMLARFQADVLARRPAVVVIQGGIEDLRSVHALDDQATTFRMAEMAATAGACVVLVDLLPTNQTGPDEWAPLPIFNEGRQLWAAGYGYKYVRAYEAFQLNGRLRPELGAGDGFGINAAGYAVLAPLVMEAIGLCPL